VCVQHGQSRCPDCGMVTERSGAGEVMVQTLAGDRGVRVFCPGRPRTKGSLKPVHIRMGAGKCRVSLTESGDYSIAWKEKMISAIRAACECRRYPGEVRVDTFFRFEKLCKPDEVMPWPTRETGEFAHGDEDKLRRNALDALTQSGLIFDDALVVGGETWKRWARDGEGAGVLIVVTPVPMTPGILDHEIEALKRLSALNMWHEDAS
jgi:Holliday junction resolvase RusA-like endonuclease